MQLLQLVRYDTGQSEIKLKWPRLKEFFDLFLKDLAHCIAR